jgi:hypothetical protein
MREGKWRLVHPNWRLRSSAVLECMPLSGQYATPRPAFRVGPSGYRNLTFASLLSDWRDRARLRQQRYIHESCIGDHLGDSERLGHTEQGWIASLLGDDYDVMLQLLPGGTESKERVEIDYSTAGDASSLNSLLQSKHWESSGGSGRLGGGILAHGHDDKTNEKSAAIFDVIEWATSRERNRCFPHRFSCPD